MYLFNYEIYIIILESPYITIIIDNDLVNKSQWKKRNVHSLIVCWKVIWKMWAVLVGHCLHNEYSVK